MAVEYYIRLPNIFKASTALKAGEVARRLRRDGGGQAFRKH